MFLISEERQGGRASISCIHGRWVLQQVARPQGLAAWHIFTQALASTSLETAAPAVRLTAAVSFGWNLGGYWSQSQGQSGLVL